MTYRVWDISSEAIHKSGPQLLDSLYGIENDKCTRCIQGREYHRFRESYECHVCGTESNIYELIDDLMKWMYN